MTVNPQVSGNMPFQYTASSSSSHRSTDDKLFSEHIQSLSTHTNELKALALSHNSRNTESPFLTDALNELLRQSQVLETQARELSARFVGLQSIVPVSDNLQSTRREPWRKLAQFIQTKGNPNLTTSTKSLKRKADDANVDSRRRGDGSSRAKGSPNNAPDQALPEKDADSMSLSGRSLNEIIISDSPDVSDNETTIASTKRNRRVPEEAIVIEKDDITAQVAARIKARRLREQRIIEDSSKRRRSSGNSDMLDHKRQRILE